MSKGTNLYFVEWRERTRECVKYVKELVPESTIHKDKVNFATEASERRMQSLGCLKSS